MPGFPEPQPGLVISYAYLWSEEAEQGRVEGRKDRPCAIVVAVETPGPVPRKRVAVVPITHVPPGDPRMAIEGETGNVGRLLDPRVCFSGAVNR